MRNRSFIIAVALVALLSAMIVLQNVRESTAPLYGPPNVDRTLVMRKVEGGALSFTEARFYSREDASRTPDGDKHEAAEGRDRAGREGARDDAPDGRESP